LCLLGGLVSLTQITNTPWYDLAETLSDFPRRSSVIGKVSAQMFQQFDPMTLDLLKIAETFPGIRTFSAFSTI
jgi:hypothetical protein